MDELCGQSVVFSVEELDLREVASVVSKDRALSLHAVDGSSIAFTLRSAAKCALWLKKLEKRRKCFVQRPTGGVHTFLTSNGTRQARLVTRGKPRNGRTARAPPKGSNKEHKVCEELETLAVLHTYAQGELDLLFRGSSAQHGHMHGSQR